MHNIMLVDMIDTLQDLTNAMATERETEREKGTNREKDVSLSRCPSSQNRLKINKQTSHKLCMFCLSCVFT